MWFRYFWKFTRVNWVFYCKILNCCSTHSVFSSRNRTLSTSNNLRSARYFWSCSKACPSYCIHCQADSLWFSWSTLSENLSFWSWEGQPSGPRRKQSYQWFAKVSLKGVTKVLKGSPNFSNKYINLRTWSLLGTIGHYSFRICTIYNCTDSFWF